MDRAAGSQHQGVSRCTREPEVDWYLSDQQKRNILGFMHAAHRISWHCPDRQAQSSPAWKISMTVLSVRSTVPPRWWRRNCKSFRKPVCRPLKLMHIRKNKSYLQEIAKCSLLSCTFYKSKRMGRYSLNLTIYCYSSYRAIKMSSHRRQIPCYIQPTVPAPITNS